MSLGETGPAGREGAGIFAENNAVCRRITSGKSDVALALKSHEVKERRNCQFGLTRKRISLAE